MLKACVVDFGVTSNRHLPLIKFAYNNSFQASIQMAPYEALYRQRCRSPICWFEVSEQKLLRPELVQETIDKIQLIKERTLIAQSHQKSYADHRHRELEFEVGDNVFLRVSPTKGIMRFGMKGKQSPRYIRPFEILERVGAVAYRLALSPGLASVNLVFHVSILRKYQLDPSHVIQHESL